MNPENTENPQPPSFFARRKGCLIALLVPLLILGLLYVYLAFVPTGYEERVNANRAAAEEILASRLGGREKNAVSPPPALSPQTPTTRIATPTLSTPVSPEEALFWEDAWTKLSNWKSIFPPVPVNGTSRIMRTDFGDLDIAAIEKRIQTELRNSESQSGRYWENEYREWISLRLPWITLQESSEKEVRIRTGITILQQMNEAEQRIFGETRDAGTTETRVLRMIGDRVDPFTHLAFYRELRNGSPEEITRWIERCALHYGEYIVRRPDSPGNLEALEELLSWMVLQRSVREEAIESVATQLASWKLTPEEFGILRTANLYERNELEISSYKKSRSKENGWHYILSGVPEKTVSRLVEPLLIRAIGRETEALIQLDAVEYGAALKARKLAAAGMNLLDLHKQEEHEKLFPVFKSEVKKQPETFNRRIAMTRFAFASARYRREHGRFPDSATDLIPRYLDESFAPTPDRLWFIFKPEPFTVLTLPWYACDLPSSATQVLIDYAKASENEGKIPTTVDDLKPYAAPGTDLTPLARCFVRIDECPVYGLVVRNDPILDEKAQSDTESGTEGGGGGTDAVGKDSQYLYFPAPLWDPDRLLASPPRESDGAHPSPESKGGEEKP